MNIIKTILTFVHEKSEINTHRAPGAQAAKRLRAGGAGFFDANRQKALHSLDARPAEKSYNKYGKTAFSRRGTARARRRNAPAAAPHS